MIKLSINNSSVEVQPHNTVLETLLANGVSVPYLCHHPQLCGSGSCRLCTVEIDGQLISSCDRQIQAGMDIVTESEKISANRRKIIELLLINHPLDCPVCDSDGECLLQNYSWRYGNRFSRFNLNKRTYPRFNLGELIAQRQNRCIHCYRCVRFYRQETGCLDFGVNEKGVNSYVGRVIDGPLKSELSGNMIDLCPTGALLNRTLLYDLNPRNLHSVASFSTFDCFQVPISVDLEGEEIMRVRSNPDASFPKPWIDDKTRYVYRYNYDKKERLLPESGSAYDSLKKINSTFLKGPSEKKAGIISADRSLEEQYLFKKLFTEKIGSSKVTAYPDPGSGRIYPSRFSELLESDFVLVIGTNHRNEYPLLTPYVRQAQKNGAKVACMTYCGNNPGFDADHYCKTRPGELFARLQRLSNGQPEDKFDQELLDALKESKNPFIVICEGRALASEIISVAVDLPGEADYIRLMPGGNSKASELLFDSPPGLHDILQDIVAGKIDHLFVYGFDILRDFPDRALVKKALENLDCLVAADYLKTDLTARADVVVSLTTQFEEPGIFINSEGRIRAKNNLVTPDERIPFAWHQLSYLAYSAAMRDKIDREELAVEIFDSFDFFDNNEISKLFSAGEIWLKKFENKDFYITEDLTTTRGQWVVFSEPYLFSGDRRAQLIDSLEKLISRPVIECNCADAQKLGADRETEISVKIDGQVLTRPVKITDNPPEGSIMIPWNLRQDMPVELFVGSRTYRRVSDIKPLLEENT